MSDDAAALLREASRRLDAGELEPARDVLNRAAELADESLAAALSCQVGRLGAAMGFDEQAEASLRTAFDIEPGGPGHAGHLIAFLVDRGRADEVAAVLGAAPLFVVVDRDPAGADEVEIPVGTDAEGPFLAVFTALPAADPAVPIPLDNLAAAGTDVVLDPGATWSRRLPAAHLAV